MIEMELAGRRTDSAVEEMAGVGAALKQLAHRGSLFEMKEAARVARRLQKDLQQLRQWRELRSSLSSKTLEELCAWVQESVMTEFPPFLLLKDTLSNRDLPLTMTEFDEWGNPENAEEMKGIDAICPYTNLRKRNYPNMFLTCGRTR